MQSVLIVDSNNDFRKSLSTALTKNFPNTTFIEAANGLDAVQKALEVLRNIADTVAQTEAPLEALADLAGYRRQVAAASAEAQSLLEAASGSSSDKAADVGRVLELLDDGFEHPQVTVVVDQNLFSESIIPQA